MNKKGISLIVLVITIIVMIIIAGAIILSLNSSNVTSKASWAKISSDRANLQSEFAVVLANFTSTKNGDFTKSDLIADSTYTTWKAKVVAAGFGVDESATDAAGIKVIYETTEAKATAYGLTVSGGAVSSVPEKDWVIIKNS